MQKLLVLHIIYSTCVCVLVAKQQRNDTLVMFIAWKALNVLGFRQTTCFSGLSTLEMFIQLNQRSNHQYFGQHLIDSSEKELFKMYGWM